jgi:hypothetical protein
MLNSSEFYFKSGGGVSLRPPSLKCLNEYIEIKNLRCKRCNSSLIVNYQGLALCVQSLDHNTGYEVRIDPELKHPPFIVEYENNT